MKVHTVLLAIVATVSKLAAADMQLTGCSVSHNHGNGGNQFSMSWENVPSQSRSTICGHFQNDLYFAAAEAGMQVKGSVECETNGSSMFTRLTLNKQSCVAEADIIGQAMAVSLGSSGPLDFDVSVCGNPAC